MHCVLWWQLELYQPVHDIALRSGAFPDDHGLACSVWHLEQAQSLQQMGIHACMMMTLSNDALAHLRG